MEHVLAIAVSLASPVVLGIFGFLWRVNTKLTALEHRVDAHETRISTQATKLQSHFEKAFTIRRERD
jgi:hypothetical protein